MGNLNVVLTESGLEIREKQVKKQESVDFWQDILGKPSRSDEFLAPPAPYGHRNNQRHIYDDLGVYLNEHHQTCLIGEIAFVFDPSLTNLKTDHSCVSKIKVLEDEFSSGSTEKEMPKHYERFGHDYSLRLSRYSIHLRFKAARQQSKKRLSTASICFQ